MNAKKEELIRKEGYPPLIPYVKELLEKLYKGGYGLAVASSSPLSYIEKVTDHWGIRKYFHSLVSGESVENPKPAPDVFFKSSPAAGIFSGRVYCDRRF